MDESHIGFMIHGFTRDEAELVQEYLETLAGQKIISINATGKESEIVAEILNAAAFTDFASADPKILMFLGFPDNLIGPAMKHFPEALGLTIFCSPTEQNLQWTMKYLIEHLIEERAALAHK